MVATSVVFQAIRRLWACHPAIVEYASFQNLLRQVIGGEPEAKNRFVDLFDPLILFQSSIHTRAPQLRSRRDSSDNHQSVWRMCFEENWPQRFLGWTFAEAVAFFRAAASHNLLRHLRKLHATPTVEFAVDLDIADSVQIAPDDDVAASETEKRLLDAVRLACCDEEQ